MDDEEMDVDGEASGAFFATQEGANSDPHRLGYNPHVRDGGYDAQLEDARMESRRKIKGRFEHIFQKYGKDYEGVADEIDMDTGVIVVNNGHLQNMEHENDAGNGDAMALSRTFEDDGADDEDEDSSSSEGEADGEGGEDGDSSSSSGDPQLDYSWQDDTAESLTSPAEDNESAMDMAQSDANLPRTPKPISRRAKGKERVSEANAIARGAAQHMVPDDILDQMPGLRDSMLALQTKYKRGQEMAPNDIQALGMSIANQLASFVKGGNASKKRKRQMPTDPCDIRDEARGRRRQRDSDTVEPVAPTPGRSPGSKSLWAPMQQPKKQKNSRAKRATAPTVDPAAEEPELDSLVFQSILQQSALEPDELQGPTTIRSCANCKTTETLSWRKGPDGTDLCNNCGMYHYRYGLMRPLESPTPSPGPESSSEEDKTTEPKPALYSANTSRPLEGVNLFGLHFSVREDAQLIKLKEIDRLTWDEIAVAHPGRTPYALQCRYSKTLHGKPCEARDILKNRGYEFYVDSKGLTVARQPGEFIDAEDDLLLKLSEEEGLDWDAVAAELPGRTAEDVEERYDELARQYLGEVSDSSSPNTKAKAKLKKAKSKPKQQRRERRNSARSAQRWTPEEDDRILRFREDDKLPWQDVARKMPGRTLSSVQRHYARDIGPRGRSRSSTPRGSPAPEDMPRSLKKYTAEEDETLIRLREERLDWEQIAEHLPTRTPASLANRWYYKTNKDNSRPSSRASSLSRNLADDGPGASLAVDLESRFDDLRNDASPEEETFSSAEDDLIVQLRELECLSWDQIAVELPGRTVSSISCRYYQYLLPRKVPEIKKKQPALDPALQLPDEAASQMLQEGDSAADELREADAKARDASGQSAGGTTRNSAKKAPATKRKRQSEGAKPSRSLASRRSDAPMLRRALQSNLNRRSESALAPANDLGGMTDGANDDAVINDDELSAEDALTSQPKLLPSAFEDPESPPKNTDRVLRSSQKRRALYPETPLQRGYGAYPSSGPTPLDHGLYITPSRYQNQSHPYFVAQAVSPEKPPSPVARNKRRRTKPAPVQSEGSGDEADKTREQGKGPFRKRLRAPQPSRAARPRQSTIECSEEEEEEVYGSDSDEAAGEYFTSRKRKSASKATQSFRGKKPAGPVRDRDDDDAPLTRSRVQSPAVEDETEEEDIDMPDLGTDYDEASSASEEGDSDDDDLRCRPRDRSPLFDPRDTIEEARSKKERGTLDGKFIAKAGDGNTMLDFTETPNDASIPPEHLVRPDYSWSELNFMALKSRAPETMVTREIYEYIEEHFPFFRRCKGHWRDSIRGNLSTRPDFAKQGDGGKCAAWCLSDPNAEWVVRPKGAARGRVPAGIERVKEPKLPKKQGRPSNASKGLPLKRVYKRNYIPAAERRRLAALQAEAGENQAAAEGAGAMPAPGSLAALVAGAEAAIDAETEVAHGGREETTEPASARDATIEASEAGQHLEPAQPSPEARNLDDQDSKPVNLGPPDDDESVNDGLVTDSMAGQDAVPNNDVQLPETQLPLPDSTFMAVVAPMTVTSDINREPESSDLPTQHPPAPIDELSSDATPGSAKPYLRSSSPAQTSARRLSRTYGKAIATPGTGRSTLFQQIAPAVSGYSAIKAKPSFDRQSRSRMGTPVTASGSKKRVVETPVRDTEGSEDELA